MNPKELAILLGLITLLALGLSGMLRSEAKAERIVAAAQATRDCEKLLSLARTPADTLSILRDNQVCLQLLP